MTYLQAVHRGNRCDRQLYWSHAFVEHVLGTVRADDRPEGAVVDHLFIAFFWTGRCLVEIKSENTTNGPIDTILITLQPRYNMLNLTAIQFIHILICFQ